MTLVYPKDISRPAPPMRTKVPFETPRIDRASGHYISKTIWHPEGFVHCTMELNLVWFDRLGWYHNVQFDTHWDVYSPQKKPMPSTRKSVCMIDFGKRDLTWTRGNMLPFCAEAADQEAAKLVEEHGLVLPELRPYVTQKWFHENIEAYYDGRLVEGENA